MNITKYIAFFISVFLFMSCEKEISIENPNKERVLVVNGYVSPEQGAIVDVSHSILDITSDSIIAITDAKVSLLENGTYLGDLSYSMIGDPQSIKRAYYTNADIEIKPENTYQLEVEHPDYENVTATTNIPQLSIDSPKLEYIGKMDEYKSKLKLTIQENKTGENFYALIVKDTPKLYEVVDGDTLELPGFGGSNVSFVEFEETGLSELASTGLEVYQTFTDFGISAIDNSFFINGKMELSFDIYTTQTSLLENQFLGQEVVVQIRQMSKNYFDYIRTLSIQEKTADDPFASEVIVTNNIDGGLGNFSGFQVINSNTLNFN